MKYLLIAATTIGLSAVTLQPAHAQVQVSVNIGAQPQWGPAGYDDAEYYYLPDVEMYYCVPKRQFVYLSGNQWVFSYNMPDRCRSYDLYNGYKVVINEPRPYLHFSDHRVAYARYRGYNGRQPVWRDRPQPRSYGYERRPDYDRGGRYEGRGDDDRGRGYDRGRHRGHDRRNW